LVCKANLYVPLLIYETFIGTRIFEPEDSEISSVFIKTFPKISIISIYASVGASLLIEM